MVGNILGAGLLLLFMIYCLLTGRVPLNRLTEAGWSADRVRRTDNPRFYWAYMTFMLVLLLLWVFYTLRKAHVGWAA
jgi:hypothetical protein